jgi:hypothetical protein
VGADGQITRLDVDHLRQALFDRSQWTTNRTSSTVRQLEDHYRLVMDLPSLA